MGDDERYFQTDLKRSRLSKLEDTKAPPSPPPPLPPRERECVCVQEDAFFFSLSLFIRLGKGPTNKSAAKSFDIYNETKREMFRQSLSSRPKKKGVVV